MYIIQESSNRGKVILETRMSLYDLGARSLIDQNLSTSRLRREQSWDFIRLNARLAKNVGYEAFVTSTDNTLAPLARHIRHVRYSGAIDTIWNGFARLCRNHAATTWAKLSINRLLWIIEGLKTYSSPDRSGCLYTPMTWRFVQRSHKQSVHSSNGDRFFRRDLALRREGWGRL